MTETTDLAAAALDLAARGFAIFPVAPRAKKPPLTTHGLKDATRDPEQITAWWARWPDANIAITTGAISGVIVIDVDDDHGGHLTLAELEHEHGPLPPTLAVLTGNGTHYLYAHPGDAELANTAGRLGAGIDTRGDGGYIIAPPSWHPDGVRYEWLNELSPAPLPAWIVHALTSPKAPPAPGAEQRPAGAPGAGSTSYARKALDARTGEVRAAPQGQRNDTLNRAACRMGELIAGGQVDEDQVVDELTAAAVSAGLAGGEISATIASGLRAGKTRPQYPDPTRTRPASSSTRPPSNTPPDDDGPPSDPPGAEFDKRGPRNRHECTDLGNARRLVEAHGTNIRHAPEWGTWLAWDGTRWKRDVTGDIDRLAKRVVDAIYTELAAEPDTDRRKEIFKHWMKSQSSSAIQALMRLARTEPGVAILSDELDADPWLLNVANGTLDLRTGAFRAHEQADLLTRKVNIAYDPAATCPTWEAFLERTVPDEDVRSFLQRAVGYTLTGLVTEQVLFFLHGVGANGKSTFQHTLLDLAGDYGTQTEPDLLLARRSEPHPTGVADLVGRRLAVAVEVDQGRRMAESLVKQLTGGDRLKARFMRQDFFEFNPTHKLWLAANHKPIVHGTDHAIWRRIRLVPFEVTIPVAEQDHELEWKLRGELPGILTWAIAGTAAWRERGLGAPASVVAATGAYRSEMDLFGAFLAEATVNGPALECAASDLFNTYKEWCNEANEKPMTKTAFGRELTERGYRAQKRGKRNVRHWVGIARRTDLSLSDLIDAENALAANPQVSLDFVAEASAFDSSRGMSETVNPSRDVQPENAANALVALASQESREARDLEPDLTKCIDCGRTVQRAAKNLRPVRCSECFNQLGAEEPF